jgi:hypothetical protein
VWEDEAWVEVRYKDDRVEAASAGFTGLPPAKLPPLAVLKVRPGLSRQEARKLLGPWTKSSSGRRTSELDRYEHDAFLSISLSGGNYAGYTYFGNFPAARAVSPAPQVVRPELTRALAEGLKKERPKVDDLLKKLGRPDRVALPHDGSRGPKGSAVLAWEEATEVRATYKDGRTIRLSGWFSPGLPHARVTAEAFRRLNHGNTPGGGKTPKQVEEVLGPPTQEVKEKDGLVVRRYGRRRVLEVFVAAGGKVADARFESRPRE